MSRKNKIPKDVNQVINDLNACQKKNDLIKKYGCTLSGLASYFKDRNLKLKRKSEWYVEEYKPNYD